MFLPIMRGTLNLPDVRDPEVLERLDQSAFYKLCLRYENHLNQCANVVAEEQNAIAQKMREVLHICCLLVNNLSFVFYYLNFFVEISVLINTKYRRIKSLKVP